MINTKYSQQLQNDGHSKVSTSLKIAETIKNYFSYKDPVPDDLKSFLVYKFTCARCSSTYIGETCHHFKTKMSNISKRYNKFVFLNIYAPLEHALTHMIIFVLK